MVSFGVVSLVKKMKYIMYTIKIFLMNLRKNKRIKWINVKYVFVS